MKAAAVQQLQRRAPVPLRSIHRLDAAAPIPLELAPDWPDQEVSVRPRNRRSREMTQAQRRKRTAARAKREQPEKLAGRWA